VFVVNSLKKWSGKVLMMTIRVKLILGLCLLLIVLGFGIVTILQTLILPEIEAVAYHNRIIDLSRVEQGIEQELKRIDLFIHDWGWWDDSYHYVAKPNRHYEKTYLTDDWLRQIKIDFIAIFNNQGQLVASLLSQTAQPFLEPFLKEQLISQTKDGIAPLLEQGGFGLVVSPIGPVLIASCQILPSKKDQPSRGYLYFGRLITETVVNELTETLHLPVQLDVVSQSPSEPVVQVLSQKLTLAEATLPLLNDDQQALRIRLVQDRPFYLQALRSAKYSLVLIFFVALFASLATYLYLEWMLIRPIMALKIESERFSRMHRPEAQYFAHLIKQDEIGQLGQAFFDMAQQIVNERCLLERERGKFEQDSLSDPLTGLGNRRYLEQALAFDRQYHANSNRLIVCIDLDHFKRVNDQHGHDVGDQVLQQMAHLLRQCCRDNDTLVRSGGEEFHLVCRDVNLDSAQRIVERIRHETAAYRFGDSNRKLRMTCSIGYILCLSQSTCVVDDLCDQKLFKIADLALYQAKDTGRNRCIGYHTVGNTGRCVLPDLPLSLSELDNCSTLIAIPSSQIYDDLANNQVA
jgi:diguanylate cyclase (GGDEF)-like protein